MTTRLTRGLGVLLLAGLIALVGGASAAGAADGGVLRLAHLSPDTPAVDVYVDSVDTPDSGILLTSVSYGTISDYQSVPAGTYTVSMRAAGAAATSAPVLSTTVTVAAGSAYTVAGVGEFASLGLEVIPDDLALPAEGQARARVVNAASTLTPADVSLADGDELAGGLAFAAQTGYVSVPGGQTTLEVSGGSSAGTDLPVELTSGSTYTVLLLDSDAGVEVRTVLDAASPGVVPTGGVEAGGGGADGGSPVLPLALGGIAASAVLGLLVTAGRRLPHRHAVAGRHAAA